jgi:hypothetical protein
VKETLTVYAIAFLIGLSITTLLLFNAALLSGGEITFVIDRYNEMWPEFILLHLIVVPVISVGLFYLSRDY